MRYKSMILSSNAYNNKYVFRISIKKNLTYYFRKFIKALNKHIN